FHPKGELLAVASSGEKVKIWDVGRSRLIQTLSCEGTSVDFSRDGALLAVGAGADIQLVSTATWKTRSSLESKERYSLYSVRFSPDGKPVACARGAPVELWDVASGKLRAALRPPAGPVRSVAFSPDSRTVAVARGRVVELWGVAGRAAPRRIQGHTGPLHAP